MYRVPSAVEHGVCGCEKFALAEPPVLYIRYASRSGFIAALFPKNPRVGGESFQLNMRHFPFPG